MRKKDKQAMQSL